MILQLLFNLVTLLSLRVGLARRVARARGRRAVSGGTRFRRSSAYREPFDLLPFPPSSCSSCCKPCCCVSRDARLKITPCRIFIATARGLEEGKHLKKNSHSREVVVVVVMVVVVEHPTDRRQYLSQEPRAVNSKRDENRARPRKRRMEREGMIGGEDNYSKETLCGQN